MAWTTPRTWTDGEVPGATIFNAHVRDNLAYLLGGRGHVLATSTEAPSETTSTNFVDADATHLAVTVTPSGTRVLLVAGVAAKASSNTMQLRLNRTDGVPGVSVTLNSTAAYYAVWPELLTGLTPGTTYTWRLQFRINISGTARVNNYDGIRLSWILALEV
jgi:hypothetical protein